MDPRRAFIWAKALTDASGSGPTHDAAPTTRISLIKTFDVSEPVANAWLQISADNDAHVWINGVDIGNTTSWRTPVCFNVTDVLRAGENTIAVDAWNEDGPAGLLASLVAFDDDGKALAEVRTDAAWQWSKSVKDNWDHLTRGPPMAAGKKDIRLRARTMGEQASCAVPGV